jgi:hypothetical protein
MQRSPRPRQAANLSDSLHQQLTSYALAAGVAGMGVLVSGQHSEAKVVYTPAHHVILSQSRFLLDLNHDGKTDFIVHQVSTCSTTFCKALLYVNGSHYGEGNLIEGVQGGSFSYAYALKQGAEIGAKRPFHQGMMYFRQGNIGGSGTCVGSWVNVKSRYLGLKFWIRGKVHFGWARLSVSCSLKSIVVGVLTGYAYETIPNKPIIAGKTKGPYVVVQHASLGELALGRK